MIYDCKSFRCSLAVRVSLQSIQQSQSYCANKSSIRRHTKLFFQTYKAIAGERQYIHTFVQHQHKSSSDDQSFSQPAKLRPRSSSCTTTPAWEFSGKVNYIATLDRSFRFPNHPKRQLFTIRHQRKTHQNAACKWFSTLHAQQATPITKMSSSATPNSHSASSTPALASASSVTSAGDFPGLSPAAIEDAILRSLLDKIDLMKVQADLINIAKHAGGIMLAADPSVTTAEIKANSSDLVTEVDQNVEKMVKDRLTQAYPSYTFLGEETLGDGQLLTDEPTFVCDPIDGTLNFIHGFYHYCISLALTVAKKPVVAVIYAPALGHMYTAVKGQGAYLTRDNGTRVPLPYKREPEPLRSLKECLGAVEWGKQRDGPNWALRTSVAKKLMTSAKEGGAMCHSTRTNGSCALSFCAVATGSVDFLWESGCLIWDVCAGWLIVEESGGIIAGVNPGEWDPTLEGRSYFPVRAAPEGQRKIVEDVWSLMDGAEFTY
jgi:myo-inositol-1(or 4)-monophosphatase